MHKEHNIRRASEQKLWNKKVGNIKEIITDSNEIKKKQRVNKTGLHTKCISVFHLGIL